MVSVNGIEKMVTHFFFYYENGPSKMLLLFVQGAAVAFQ